MSLQILLEEFSAKAQKAIPPEALAVMEAAARELDEVGIGSNALKEGDLCPAADLYDGTGAQVALKDLLSRGPLILVFYRGGWCPYCNLELRAYQDLLGDIEAAGGRLVAVSPETPAELLSTAEKNELGFEVLSDKGNQLAADLGLAFDLPEMLRPLYLKFGNDLTVRNNQAPWKLPIPATYVVGQDGRIALAHVDRDYRQRLEPQAALEVLRRLKKAA